MNKIYDHLKSSGKRPSQSFSPYHSIFWGEFEIRLLSGSPFPFRLLSGKVQVEQFESEYEAISYLVKKRSLEIKAGDTVNFQPLPQRKIDYLSGKKMVKSVRTDGLFLLECGNIVLHATKTECVKIF